MNRTPFFAYRKRRREAVLRRMAAMRDAKERRRLERGLVEREPRLERSTGLSWAVRDDISGSVVWMELKSARNVYRRVAVLLREYTPGFPV